MNGKGETMTKVEELRSKIVDRAQGVSFSEITDFLALLDNYAAAARAEGAEQERERIREASSYMAEGTQADCDQLYVHKEYHQGTEYHVILVGGDFYMVDPSVLAPTKEGDL